MSYWEQYFQSKGVKPEVGARFWKKQEQCKWRSQFDYHETADRWIARATEEERIQQEVWKPKGTTPQERFNDAQRCILDHYDHPGKYSEEDVRRIRECIRDNG